MSKSRNKRNSPQVTSKGYVYIQVSFNNTIVTITNTLGQTITWSSAGKIGFSNTKKSTPYAARQASYDAAQQAFKKGMREVIVRVKGLATTREATITAISTAGLQISSIQDVTPVPYNGCRPPKKRNL